MNAHARDVDLFVTNRRTFIANSKTHTALMLEIPNHILADALLSILRVMYLIYIEYLNK